MPAKTTVERILIVGDASSAESAGIRVTDSCTLDYASSLSEAAAKQAAQAYDRVIIDPGTLSGPPLQLICGAEVAAERDALRLAEERQRLAESAGGVGLWEWDLVTGEAAWDDACKALFGLPPDADVSLDVFVSLIHPDDREEVFALNEQALSMPMEFAHTFRAILPDGRTRWFAHKGRSIADESGCVVRVLGASIDITDRKTAEDAVIEQGQLLATTIDATHAMIVYLDRDFRFVFANRAYIEACGHTWDELEGRNHFDIFPNAENEAIFATARDTGERVEFKAKPFEYSDQPWRGVTYWDWTLVPVKDIEGVVTGLVFSLMDVTENKRAEHSVLRANERLRILSDTASALLVSEKPQECVQSLCERVMKHLDCDVFVNFLVVDEKGCLHLNACAGIPDDEAKKIEWLEYGVAVCGCVARDGCRIIAEDIMHTPDPRTDLVKSYGIQAYACHPLLSQGGKTIGTLSFGAKSRPCFADDEIALMKTVADQVSTAIDRIRVLEKERHIAQVLQDALIPPAPPERLGNYRFAVRYKAALEEASVGGDFYDIFEIGDGRIGVLIGDVAGKGLSAAISVAAARHSIRGYAYIDPRPGNVLTLANNALCRNEAEENKMLTAFFAVIDTRTGTMVYANAGHEPAFLLREDGTADEMRIPAVPLGVVAGFTFDEASVRLRPRDRIVLVTDGITEARRPGPALFGIERVLEYLTRHCEDPIEALADGMLRAAVDFVEEALQDDAAILVIEQSDDSAISGR